MSNTNEVLINGGNDIVSDSVGIGWEYTNDYIEIDITKKYKFSFDLESDATNYNPNVSHIIGFASYDRDKRYIHPQYLADQSGLASRTELSRAYNASDLKLYIKDGSHWLFNDGSELTAVNEDGSWGAGVSAQFVWYPFENYPDYGYSRNYRGHSISGPNRENSYNDTYQPAYKKLEKISDNEWEITLFNPLNVDLPTNTKIKATYGWGGYNYQMGSTSPSGTKHYEYIVEGAYLAGNGTTFREATKYIKGLYWLNRDAANKVTIKNWKLYEIK
jgi:hypothetical protein